MVADRSGGSLIEAVDAKTIEEARLFNSGLERILANQPSVHLVPVEVTRRVRRAGGGIFPPPVLLPEARELEVPGRPGRGKIRVRALPPPAGRRARGALLYFHGGGWMLGGCDLEDRPLAACAAATGLVVVSVEYRLAPEHPYPAAVDDAEDAARWLLTAGAEALGVPERFVLGGESAGAHLAVLALLRLRDGGGSSAAFRAANLVFGPYDLTMTPSGVRWGDRNLVLSAPIMRFFTDGFLRGVPESERRAPHVSPLYADLRGLPPALFTVGTVDPLLDDSLFMAARWRAAGGEAELRVWPEGIHGFVACPLALARLARAEEAAFLSRFTER